MRVGFTGTRQGMTEIQKNIVRHLLSPHEEFHHGDCVGADYDAHMIAKALGMFIAVHPPEDRKFRAYCNAPNILYAAQPYLVRNKAIVNATDFLVATPAEYTEQLRSGTWSTIRYAKSLGKNVSIVLPDGKPYEGSFDS